MGVWVLWAEATFHQRSPTDDQAATKLHFTAAASRQGVERDCEESELQLLHAERLGDPGGMDWI